MDACSSDNNSGVGMGPRGGCRWMFDVSGFHRTSPGQKGMKGGEEE